MKWNVLSWIFILFATILVIISISEPYFIISEKLTDKDEKVAAFYYGWYSNSTDYSQTSPYNISDDEEWRHWDGTIPEKDLEITNHPIYGLYDSADPDVIEKHLRQAEWAGLDAFIVSYWGKDGVESDNFINMLEVAKNISSNITFSLYFETAMADLPEMEEADAIDFLSDELEFIYETMTLKENKDYIWFEDDKPVLFLYVVQWLTPTVWEGALKELEDKDHSFFLVADRPGNFPQYNSLFQATHTYDGYAPIRDGYSFTNNLMLKRNARVYDQLYIASVHPGYDDTNVRDGNPPFKREGGDYYKARWDEAVSLNPDWIVIISWNEWHEGTEIEPSIEHGDKALKQTKEYIKEFKSGNYNLLTKNTDYFPYLIWSFIGLAASWVVFLTFPTLNKKISGRFSIKINSKIKNVLLYASLLLSWLGVIAYLTIEFILGYILMISGSFFILLLPLLTVLNRSISVKRNLNKV